MQNTHHSFLISTFISLSLSPVVADWNFINNFRRGTTPAMMEGLADHRWDWNDFLMYHYAV